MKRIAVLMTTVFIDMLGFAMIFPLLPFYAERLNAEVWVIGWLMATHPLAQILFAPGLGRLSDRYGRRPVLLLGLGCSAVAFVVFGLATELWMLFVSRFVQGVGGGMAAVAQAFVGDSLPPSERSKALGWLSAAGSAGVMLGPALGSLTASVAVAAPGFLAAGLCIVNILFAWRWLPESSPGSEPEGSAGRPSTAASRTSWAVALRVLREPGDQVSRLIWIYAIGMLGFMSLSSVLALYLELSFGVTEQTIGYYFVYIGALSLVLRGAVLGVLIERLGETRVLRLGALSLTLGLALLPLLGSLPLLALGISFVPLGTACLFPTTSSLVTQHAPKHELGQVLGVQQSFGGVARVVAPLWATSVFQGFGPSAPFPIAAAIVAGVAVLAFRLREPLPPVAVGTAG